MKMALSDGWKKITEIEEFCKIEIRITIVFCLSAY